MKDGFKEVLKGSVAGVVFKTTFFSVSNPDLKKEVQFLYSYTSFTLMHKTLVRGETGGGGCGERPFLQFILWLRICL